MLIKKTAYITRFKITQTAIKRVILDMILQSRLWKILYAECHLFIISRWQRNRTACIIVRLVSTYCNLRQKRNHQNIAFLDLIFLISSEIQHMAFKSSNTILYGSPVGLPLSRKIFKEISLCSTSHTW